MSNSFTGKINCILSTQWNTTQQCKGCTCDSMDENQNHDAAQKEARRLSMCHIFY